MYSSLLSQAASSSLPPPPHQDYSLPWAGEQVLIHRLIVERDNMLDFKIIRLLVMRV